MMKVLLEAGVQGLIEYARNEGVSVDLSKHYSACRVCREIVDKLTWGGIKNEI